MSYVTPQLTLIGKATGVVLGGIPLDPVVDTAPSPVYPHGFDFSAALEAEW